MKLISDAFNTRFGVNLSDDELLKYLDDMEAYLNGDADAA